MIIFRQCVLYNGVAFVPVPEENAEGSQSMPIPVHPHTHGYLAESAKIPSHKDL